jgi:hypothetical protein
MTKENEILKDLKSFLSKKSSQKRRIRILNFLYSGKQNYPEESSLSKTTKSNITEDLKSPLYREYINKLDDANNIENVAKLNEWSVLVENIKKFYLNYLKAISKVETFKYLIISEAPMLTVNNPIALNCNYIFDPSKPCTIYRKVPYQAFSDNYKNSQPGAQELIDVLIEKSVLFIDLISIPLPTIDSDLREKWSRNINWVLEETQTKEPIPLPLTLLKISFKHVITELKKIKCTEEIKFDKNLKIVLMLPPKTSIGIVDYLAENPINRCESLPNELKNQVISLIRLNDYFATIESPDLKRFSLRRFRQVAMNPSNNHCVDHFKHAIK